MEVLGHDLTKEPASNYNPTDLHGGKMSATMKALVKSSGMGLEYREDVPFPETSPNDVILKVLSASICGSDLHIYNNDGVFGDRVVDGRVTGHELCGEIIKVGEQVKTLAVGDIVSAESHVACGSCHYCRNGMSHICQEVSAIGFDRPGGFAQYTVLPAANAIVLPKEIHPDVGACLEPFGNAVYTSRRVDLVNKVVWVIGCGPQGLMSIAVAKAAGARKVIATETKAERLKLARDMSEKHSDPREKYEDLIINPNDDPEFLRKIYQATNGLGVDVIIEMSGSPKAIEDGLLALKKRGTMVVLGLSSKPKLEISWNNGIVLKEATVIGIYGRLLYETWTEVSYLLTSQKVTLDPIMYPKQFALKDYKEAFELVLNGKAAKVIFKPNDL